MHRRKSAIIAAAAFALLVLLAGCAWKPQPSKAALRLNEVMASNSLFAPDEAGVCGDWIELCNAGEAPLELADWAICDGNDAHRFVFPSYTMEPGALLVLFADGKQTADAANGIFHLPFSVSKSGETLRLFAPNGETQDEMQVPPLEKNQSFGIAPDGQPAVLPVPTPGKENDKTADALPQPAQLLINEYATNKTQTLLSDRGEFVSWAELYNAETTALDLSGFFLSDDEAEPQKWSFPSVTIEAGGYLVVFLSGESRDYDGSGQLHADFELSGKEDGLFLSDAYGREVDRCKVYPLFSNLTCGRTDDGTFAFFSAATPGKQNVARAFSSVDTAARTDSKTLVITEVAAVNTTAPSPGGVFCDYVELFNASAKPISLKNYRLSDSKKPESFLPLPAQTLQPGQYQVIYCTDKTGVGGAKLDLGLNRYGETLYLAKKSGEITDSLRYGRLFAGTSCGRNLSGSAEPVYYNALTPGRENPKKALSNALENPVFSQESGYAEPGDTIEIACSHPVYYTLNGSEPTQNDHLYTQPIVLQKTATVRARAFEPGSLPSDTVTATYLIEQKHDLPVVFLSADNADLFSQSRGILADGPNKSSEFPYLGANYWQDWERPAHFEYMTEDGVSQLSFDCGIKVFGQFSRALEQKSLAVYLRDRYGPGEICYPLFEKNDVNVFSSLVLRNSGQDFSSAHLRDAFCAMAMKNQVDVDIMDYQPVAVYLNGEYYGLYDLREKINGDYLEHHYGADVNNTDLIKGNSNVQLGSMDDYNRLIQYVKTHDVRQKDVYEKVCSLVDIDNLICYWMCESFFCNTDTGNIRFYREKTGTGRWRWIFFDVDWALFPTTYHKNSIAAYLNPEGHGVNHAFSTTLMVQLMKNAAFRKRVLELNSTHLKTTFASKRLLKLLDRMAVQIEPEMRRHCARWRSVNYEAWQRSVKQLRAIVAEMPGLFREKMIRGFAMTEKEIQTYLK